MFHKEQHAAYMRRWRKTHPLTEAQRIKDRARSYANVYLKRGHLERQPCKCGELNSQMHHEDYTKPLEIEWLCRPCHLRHHAKVAEISHARV
jgi:hypothetical protein